MAAAHLVSEALSDTDDHVLDQALDGSQASNVLAAAVPDHELDFGALGGFGDSHIHVDVLDALCRQKKGGRIRRELATHSILLWEYTPCGALLEDP